MSGKLFEILGEVDDGDGFKGALLGADTTSNAQLFRDESEFACWSDINAILSHAHHRARFAAFLPAFLWFALVFIHDGNAGRGVRVFVSALGL